MTQFSSAWGLLTYMQVLEPGTAVVHSPILGIVVLGSDTSRGRHGTVPTGRLHDRGHHRGDSNPGENASLRQDRRHTIAGTVMFGLRRFRRRYRSLDRCHVGDFPFPHSFRDVFAYCGVRRWICLRKTTDIGLLKASRLGV